MLTLALSTVLVIAACAAALALWEARGGPIPGSPGGLAEAQAPACATVLRVVTAASYSPVLAAVAPGLAAGEDCARLEVTVADGRAAAGRVAEEKAHVWIPDDSAWAGVAGATQLARPGPGGSGTVVATSPIYFVTDPGTAQRVAAAGGSWLGLAGLVAGGAGVRMVVRDPAGSGDGLVAAGAVGEAVWMTSGMDASAGMLAKAVASTRTVAGTAAALPERTGDVGLVPEYALLSQGAAGTRGHTVLAPADHTALLRYTWLPSADASADPAVAGAMTRLLHILVGPDAAAPLAAAGLRGPEYKPSAATAPNAAGSAVGPPAGTAADRATAGTAAAGGGNGTGEPPELPLVTAEPFGVLGAHHVEHVFATWYAADRRSDMLVVVDVSGSMAQPAPGSDTPLIDLVRAGCDRIGGLLPDDSRLALWEFGSRLDPPLDYREVLPSAELSPPHRQALATAVAGLAAQQTGTGLYDTLLAAYVAARDGYRDGVPDQVVLFTDGRSEDDPGSISMAQLAQALGEARDPKRPVQLTVLTFGDQSDADQLIEALKPVGGYTDVLRTADDVRAAFIHVAAGGLHH